VGLAETAAQRTAPQTVQLRPYQETAKARIYKAWERARNVGLVLPTGAGKTVLFSNIINEYPGAVCAIAHRQELVSQISLALAMYGVRHRIIGQSKLVKFITQIHLENTGRSYYDANSETAVAGVDTIIRRGGKLGAWAQAVRLWVCDELHHLQSGNKWGKAVSMFPNARGLGVTATPCRADGRGLGSDNDGLIDELVIGVGMRELIDAGFLTEYRIFAPPCDLDLDGIDTAANGDFNQPQLRERVRRSRIIGDVVQEYKRRASGRLGVTFATDVDTAAQIARAFNEAGVRAEMLCATTPDRIRFETVRRFARRDIMQLVNVDLFGEGFDLPAIECVSFARPTQSFSLFCQQFGRSLRPMPGKSHAVIIDHAGNVMRHGLPDAPRPWTLARRERKTAPNPDLMPVRVCPACTGVYERTHRACPYCQHVPEPAARTAPEFVDGDLTELDPDVLAAMRRDVSRIDGPARIPDAAEGVVRLGIIKRHRERQEAQAELRDAIAWWAGHQRAAGRVDSESYRRFYHGFGVDVLSAQALGRPEAIELTGRINSHIGR